MISKDDRQKEWRARNKEKIKKAAQEYYIANREKLLEQSKQYYESNTEQVRTSHKNYYLSNKDRAKNSKLKHLYSLSREDYESMVEKQDNSCACCGEPFIRTPHVDHCHTTGVVRGLLCVSCNTGLGQYEKRKSLFEQYLVTYGKGAYFDKS